MKRTLTLVIAILFAVIAANAQSGWIDHKGDNRISVKFPSEPKEVIPGTFAMHDAANTAYVFTIVDFVQVAGIDSVALAPIKESAEFTDQLKVGINQSLPDVTLADFKIGKWKGFTSYTSTGVDSKKQQYDLFIVLIGNKLYNLSIIRAEGTGTETRDEFLNSITLTN